MRTLRNEVFLLLAAFLLLAILVRFFGGNQNQPKEKQLICLNQTTKFLDALKRQRQGIVMVRDHKTNVTNYEATLENLPGHFNGIWGEQFNTLEILKLQAEPTEVKYFLKFKNSTTKSFGCMVVTLGVGHTVQAEMELKNSYPHCKFLALDPDSDINADLVENKLNGTFIKRAIGAEDTYTADMKANLYGKGEGIEFNKQLDEPPIGFFDFFLYYNSESVIDLLTIDVEGSEFTIFQLLAEQYDQLPITLCQMNIEFHHFPALANLFLRQRFFHNFDMFIRNNRFALLKTESYGALYRVFFVNFVNKICVEKFLC